MQLSECHNAKVTKEYYTPVQFRYVCSECFKECKMKEEEKPEEKKAKVDKATIDKAKKAKKKAVDNNETVKK